MLPLDTKTRHDEGLSADAYINQRFGTRLGISPALGGEEQQREHADAPYLLLVASVGEEAEQQQRVVSNFHDKKHVLYHFAGAGTRASGSFTAG